MHREGPGTILSDARGDGREPVRVRIAGGEYVLRGPGGAEHVQALAAELDRRLRAVIDSNPRLALHQALVLCALELLDELRELRRQRPPGGARRREAPGVTDAGTQGRPGAGDGTAGAGRRATGRGPR